MKKALLILLILLAVACPALCGQAGSWGIGAVAVSANYTNQLQLSNAFYNQNSIYYPGFFYYVTDRLSVDLGFAYDNQQYKNHDKSYFNSVYFSAMYELGGGPVVPHIGIEYINTLVGSGHYSRDDYTQVTKAIVFGGEYRPVNDFSVIMDLRVVENDSFTTIHSSQYASVVNMMPIVSLRWYL